MIQEAVVSVDVKGDLTLRPPSKGRERSLRLMLGAILALIGGGSLGALLAGGGVFPQHPGPLPPIAWIFGAGVYGLLGVPFCWGCSILFISRRLRIARRDGAFVFSVTLCGCTIRRRRIPLDPFTSLSLRIHHSGFLGAATRHCLAAEGAVGELAIACHRDSAAAERVAAQVAEVVDLPLERLKSRWR